VEIKTKEIKAPDRAANGTWAEIDFGPLRECRKAFQIFFSANLNLNPRFKHKPNIFLNLDKFNILQKQKFEAFKSN
jgi:hypothetical protein